MKIAFEIGWGHKAGGARRVAINTLLAMAEQRPDHNYIVYSNCIHEQLNQTTILQFPIKAPSLMPQVLWDQIFFPHVALPLRALWSKPDVIHYTNNIVSYWGPTPAVVTIHDMTPFVIPKSYGRVHGAYQRSYFKFAVRKASKIITVSKNSKEDICRILKVNENKVVVVQPAAALDDSSALATSSSIDLLSRFGIKGPFILYVGAIHPRKNVGRIIEAFARLKRDKGIPHQLVIAGILRWMAETSIKTSAFSESKDHMVFTGKVSDAELIRLYSKCDAFVWPSLYEGFGLPVLEAMSFGAPVVTSNCSSLPEVAGDAAVLVNPLDVEEIIQGIWMVLEQTEFSDELRRKGLRQAQRFSWKSTAKKVLDVLESVV